MFVSKLTKAAALSGVFLLLFSSQLLAQNNNRNDVPISDEHYEILEKRKNLIEQELSSGSSEWSGVYQFGDHHPTVFMWSENQGFLTWGSNHTFYLFENKFRESKVL